MYLFGTLELLTVNPENSTVSFTAFRAVSPRHQPAPTGNGPAPTCLDRHQSRAGLCRSISSL